jgi:DNA polymerase-3 subunit gamma/tau
VAIVLRRVAEIEKIDIDEHALALVSRHATGSFRDALGTLEQLLTYKSDRRIEPDDVLAVLGVADDELLFESVRAIVDRDPAQGLRIAARLADSGRDPGQVLRDLERYARELLAVQILDEVPPELRVTPDRDRRLAEQARAVPRADAVRLLDLIAGALEASANGAQPRIQLELVLIKAAAPEVDPSVSALLARIERLEGGATDAPPLPRESAAASPPPRESAPAPPPPREAASASPPREGASPPPPPREAPPPEPELTNLSPGAADEPAPPSPPQQPPVDLESAVGLWPAVVERVRERNAMLAALLADAKPVAVSDSELTVAFPSGAEFLKRKAEQDEHRRAATSALKQVWGRALAVRYELGEFDADEAPGGQALSGEELVRRFMEEFDAEELLDEDEQHEREAQS